MTQPTRFSSVNDHDLLIRIDERVGQLHQHLQDQGQQLSTIDGRLETVETACRAGGLINGAGAKFVTWKQARWVLVGLIALASGGVAINWSMVSNVASVVAK